MPRFDLHFSAQAQVALEIVRAGEIVRAARVKEWTIKRLESLYELAYLRSFVACETCLEAVFYRSLCGYASSAGQETLIGIGGYYPTLAHAEAAVLGGSQYALWHNPWSVIRRCKRFIRSGVAGCPGLEELTVSSNVTRIEHLAAIRHRIVHNHSDAKSKFDAATFAIAGKVYPASRPGKFLRDVDRSIAPRRRWLNVTIDELTGLAGQIV